MLRDQTALLAADLTRTLEGTWSCTIDNDYVMRVIGPRWHGVVEIDSEVDEEIWPGEDGDVDDLDRALEEDAGEVVADQVVELLGNAQIDWPGCPAHRTRLVTSSGVWTCEDGSHDVAEVGQLGASNRA